MTDLPLAGSASGCGCGTCGCGSADDAPVLDVRAIPAAVRHAAVHGALDSLPVASSLVLLAPHRPAPLLAELDERHPGAFAVSYDAEGPDTWAVRLTRTA
jgi:uncharacterized protein (DUF2249 family)